MDPAFRLAPELYLQTLMLASVRCGAALALLPALGGQLIPLRVRIGLSGALGWLLIGTDAAPAGPADLLSLSGLFHIMGEILIGMVIALALHTAFSTALVAGEWIAQSMGLGFAAQVIPGSLSSPLLSGLFSLLMWSVALSSGAHLLILRLIAESYVAMPEPAALFEPERLWLITSWGGFAFASGMMAALPLGATLLLLNLALAVASRSAPQLNLFSIGFPLMLLVGLGSLPLALPALSDVLSGSLTHMQDELAQVLLG